MGLEDIMNLAEDMGNGAEEKGKGAEEKGKGAEEKGNKDYKEKGTRVERKKRNGLRCWFGDEKKGTNEQFICFCGSCFIH